MTTPIKTNKPVKTNESLFFGVNKNGEIIQFDKQCQTLTGYHREDVLNRSIIDFLIPESHILTWKKLIETITDNKPQEDVKIAWKTSNGKEITLALNSIPLNTKKSSSDNYLFIGHKVNHIAPHEHNKHISSPSETNLDYNHHFPLYDSQSTHNQNKSDGIPNELGSQPITIDDTNIHSPITNNESKKDTTYQKDTTISSKSMKSLLHKITTLEQKIKDLEKKDRSLERQNKQLEKTINNLTKPKKINIPTESAQTDYKTDELPSLKLKIRKIFTKDNKTKDNLQKEIENLNNKTKELYHREKILIQQDKAIKQKMTELSKYKEKLLDLETEIQRRQQYLSENQNKQSTENQDTERNSINQNPLSDTPLLTQDSLEDLEQSAVVLQRGLFKAVNKIMTETFGYSQTDLINKSFYDLIPSEGLPNVEKFHLNRLKGKSISSYSTVLLDKNQDKISVDIAIQPILYSDSKAELALIHVHKDHNLNNNKPKQDLSIATAEENTIESEKIADETNKTEKTKKPAK